jgi:hypothetical protein
MGPPSKVGKGNKEDCIAVPLPDAPRVAPVITNPAEMHGWRRRRSQRMKVVSQYSLVPHYCGCYDEPAGATITYTPPLSQSGLGH